MGNPKRQRHSKLAILAVLGVTAVGLVSWRGVTALSAWRAERRAERAAKAKAARDFALDQASAAAERMVRKVRRAAEESPTVGLVMFREFEWPAELHDRVKRMVAELRGDLVMGRWGGVAAQLVEAGASSPLLSLSSDGRSVAVVSNDEPLRVVRWDAPHKPIIVVDGTFHHDLAVMSLNADGTRVLTVSDEGVGRVWAVGSNPSGPVLELGPVTSARFSPDGTRLVAVDPQGRAKVMSFGGATTSVPAEAGEVASAWFSPDGTRLVTMSKARSATMWSADGVSAVTYSTEELLRTWPEDVEARPRDERGELMSASPDGRWLLVRSAGWQVWPADGKGKPGALGDEVSWASFSPDGASVLIAATDWTARVRRADGTGKPVVLRGHTAPLRLARWSPDGAFVLTTSEDRTARVWRADGMGEPVVLRGHTGAVRDAVFSPDGAWVMTVAADGTVRRWRADGGRPVDLPLSARMENSPRRLRSVDRGRLSEQTESEFAAVFTADGQSVVTHAYEPDLEFDRLYVWPVSGGTPVALRQPVGDGNLTFAAVSPDGSRIVASYDKGPVRIWRTDGTGESLLLPGLAGEQRSAWLVRFSTTAEHVLGVVPVKEMNDSLVVVWRVDGNGEPTVLRAPETSFFHDANFGPDGSRIWTLASDGVVRVWRVDGDDAPVELRAPCERLAAVDVSPDGGWAVLRCSAFGGAFVARLDSSEVVRLESREFVEDVTISADGSRLLLDHGVSCSLSTPAGVITELPFSKRWTNCRFIPNGTRILSLSHSERDGNLPARVHVWSVGGSSPPTAVDTLDSEPFSVDTAEPVRVSPDGAWFAASVLTDHGNARALLQRLDGAGEPVLLGNSEGEHVFDIVSAQFSPDGTRLMGFSKGKHFDGRYGSPRIRIWPLRDFRAAPWELTSSCLTADERLRYLDQEADAAGAANRSCRQALRERAQAAPKP